MARCPFECFRAGGSAFGSSLDSGHVSTPDWICCGGSGTCHALRPHAALLIRDHAPQNRLVGLVGHHLLVQLFLSLPPLRGQNVAGGGLAAANLAPPGRLLLPEWPPLMFRFVLII